MYTLSDFDFDLPTELIAQVPLPERAASRLLQADKPLSESQKIEVLADLESPAE